MRRPRRDRDGERRALADLAVDGDAAAVELHELAHEGEPDPGPFVRPSFRPAHAMEALEDVRELVVRDPDARVPDREPDLPVLLRERDRDATLERELEGVREEVEDH